MEKPVKDAVDGGTGSFRGLRDRPAMEFGVIIERLKEDLQDVEQPAGDPHPARQPR
jgi:hypothetical protein